MLWNNSKPAWLSPALPKRPSNFVRIHTKLRVTPAMEAGITARVWELADLLAY
jgi:hypothetical protein